MNDRSGEKRLLLISYYFPPSGGPGVQRSLKFAKYLPQFGWQPTILTVRPDRAAYPDFDPSLSDDIPDFLTVERTNAWDPYALYARLTGRKKHEAVGVGLSSEGAMGWKERTARFVRANLFLPDARVGWIPFAIRRGRQLLQQQRFDALITSGPPHSSHLIARSLSGEFRLPWIADFRDPWTDISWYHELPLSPPALRFDAALERSVLEKASAVVTVSAELKRILSSKTTTPVYVIQNGFDEEDFRNVSAEEEPDFVLTHTGTLTASQNPISLWKAIRSLQAEGLVPGLKIRMVGNVDAAVLQSIRDHSLEERLELIAYVPHEEAIRYMKSASLLLLSINRAPDATCIITGKAFEYVASGRPVLGIGPVPGDAAMLMQESGAGKLFDYDDVQGVRGCLLRHYEAWKQGAPLHGASLSAAGPYSRRSQASSLAGVLNELVSGSRTLQTG